MSMQWSVLLPTVHPLTVVQRYFATELVAGSVVLQCVV